MESALESVFEALVVFLFWPAIALSVFVSGSGIAQRKAKWLLWGSLLALPSSLYFAATPNGRIALLLPFFHLLGTLTLHSRKWLATVFLCLYVGFFWWLLVFPLWTQSNAVLLRGYDSLPEPLRQQRQPPIR